MSIENSKPTSEASTADICPVCLDEKLVLPYRAGCGHVFCYMCLKAAYQQKQACPMCRAPLPVETYEGATTEDETFLHFEGPYDGLWLYKGRNSGWWRYDPVTNQNIEDGYQNYLRSLETLVPKTVDNGSDVPREDEDLEDENLAHEEIDYTSIIIGILGRDYTIDFVQMVQRPSQSYGGSRAIKRVEKDSDPEDEDILIKGVAGLRISKPPEQNSLNESQSSDSA